MVEWCKPPEEVKKEDKKVAKVAAEVALTTEEFERVQEIYIAAIANVHAAILLPARYVSSVTDLPYHPQLHVPLSRHRDPCQWPHAQFRD
eukprot:1917133-Rhodomonas_salina.2